MEMSKSTVLGSLLILASTAYASGSRNMEYVGLEGTHWSEKDQRYLKTILVEKLIDFRSEPSPFTIDKFGFYRLTDDFFFLTDEESCGEIYKLENGSLVKYAKIIANIMKRPEDGECCYSTVKMQVEDRSLLSPFEEDEVTLSGKLITIICNYCGIIYISIPKVNFRLDIDRGIKTPKKLLKNKRELKISSFKNIQIFPIKKYHTGKMTALKRRENKLRRDFNELSEQEKTEDSDCSIM
ncbi:hypothetical protein ACFLY6_02735 [Candidatus Dependentiae bacterium]